VSAEDAGQRLDVWIAARAGVTRSRAARLIEDGCGWVAGKPAGKAGVRLSAGAAVAWRLPEPLPTALEPEPLPLDILYEDADLAVVCKPRGMVVHPAPGNARGTLVHALLYHLKDLSGIGGVTRPGIVHRLDKDTSGLLLVAKNDAAHLALSAQLKARRMCKLYAALAQGVFAQEAGRIDAPIARDPKDRKRMAVVANGRPALTEYRVAGRLPGEARPSGEGRFPGEGRRPGTGRQVTCALLCVHLVTGRTHQIRVHLRSAGHPLVGDPVYGGRGGVRAPCLMLHARRLTFEHPTSGLRMTVTAPWPADFLEALQHLAGSPDEVERLLKRFDALCDNEKQPS
jgi:23S rRNA pseudouridine1911/1915/1917 synthase